MPLAAGRGSANYDVMRRLHFPGGLAPTDNVQDILFMAPGMSLPTD